MKVFFVLLGVGVGLALIGAIVPWRRRQIVSPQWLKEQERADLIQAHQWDGVVRWPWGATDEGDAA